MEKRGNFSKRKRKKMGLPLQKESSVLLGDGLIGYIQNQLSISQTMIAGLIEVTDKTLASWTKKSISDLQDNAKSSRLITLYELIVLASDLGVDRNLILSLLHEPIDPSNSDSGSLLTHIVKEPSSQFLKEMAPRLIRDFLSFRVANQSIPDHLKTFYTEEAQNKLNEFNRWSELNAPKKTNLRELRRHLGKKK